LMNDGLDGLAVVSDLEDLTKELKHFRWNVPEYTEYLDDYPEKMREKLQPGDLVPLLRDSMLAQADQLKRDINVTTANIRGSAELRQAVANTIVQRRLLALTIVAIVIALLGLIISLNSSGH
jgi:hypothetical protein